MEQKAVLKCENQPFNIIKIVRINRLIYYTFKPRKHILARFPSIPKKKLPGLALPLPPTAFIWNRVRRGNLFMN